MFNYRFMKKQTIFTFSALLVLAGCQQTMPEVELPESAPEVKVTNFSEALRELGLMTEIYDTGVMRIQSNDIGDVTGASLSTGSEIPRDITEMMKSTLNSIGGNILYIPYDPSFVSNQMATGYSNFENKIIPDVVITGGITEFDRGLETTGDSTNFSVSSTVKGEGVGLEYGDQDKTGLARITLDFNMLNFQTMAGIPRMNAVNSMKVHKAQAETGMSISLFGVTFGSKGERKKVQGRHEAVRLLVELSVIQMVGKYAGVPYWRLLGDGALPDQDVLHTVKLFYHNLEPNQRIENAQEWLYIHGYDAPFTGVLDQKTQRLLREFDPSHDSSGNSISEKTFEKLYLGLPVTYEALSKRKRVAKRWEQFADTAVAVAEPVEAPAPGAVGMSVKLSSDKSSYRVGDELKLSVKTNKNGFLRCYYQDGTGIVAQIYPNPFQPKLHVQGNKKLYIPNAQTVGGNFAIEMSNANALESFVCLASEENFPRSLGNDLLGQGLEALNFRGLDDIVNTYQGVLGRGVAVSSLQVRVN